MKRSFLLLFRITIVLFLVASVLAFNPGRVQADTSAIIPAGATNIHAELNIFVGFGYGDNPTIHPVTAAWDESTVTWNSFYTGGTQYGAAAGSLSTIVPNAYIKADVTSIVLAWLGGTTNNGILLDQRGAFPNCCLAPYNSSENPEFQPFLRLTYTVNGSPVSVDVYAWQDAHIWQLHPDANYGTEDWLHTGWYTDVLKQALLQFDVTQEETPPQVGTGTQGFWKNHPDAWPVDQITIGGVAYSKAQAIAYMQASVAGDMTYAVFSQLVAAKLNLLIGTNPACISTEVSAVDAWMALHPIGSKVAAKTSAFKAIQGTYTALDQYNNGLLCAPHRD